MDTLGISKQEERDIMTKVMLEHYSLGIDIGSTTVKYVLCDQNFNILAKAYTPHDTKQGPTLLKLLEEHGLEYKGFSGIGLDFKCLYYSTPDNDGAKTIGGASYKDVYISLLETLLKGGK